MKRAMCLTLVGLLLFSASGCSSTGQVDLGGGAGNGAAGGIGAVARASPGSGTPSLPHSSMTVRLGTTRYDFDCNQAGALTSQGWQGPGITASWQADPASGCGWPRTNPRFFLNVLFTGFLASAGFEAGTYDLARPTPQKVVVTFSAVSQAELPVGAEPAPYAGYSSSPVDVLGSDAQSPATAVVPSLPADGASGLVTVVKYVANPESSPSSRDFDVTLAHVVLPLLGNSQGYPSTVTIESARMVSLTE